MGFFGGTKTYVYANTSALCEVNEDAVSDAVLYAIVSEYDITSKVINTLLNGMGTKMQAMRKYAKSHYTLGLPTTTLSELAAFDNSDVIDAIETATGVTYGIELSFNLVTPLTVLHAILPHLINIRGWNSIENTFSNMPASLGLVDTYNHHTMQYSITIKSLTLNDTQTAVTITYSIYGYYTYRRRVTSEAEVTYTTETVSVMDTTYTETVAISSSLAFGHNYCIAGYQEYLSDGSLSATTKWWFYDISLKTYPNLVLRNSVEETNNLYPVVPIRYKNTSITDSSTAEIYSTGKKTLSKIGLDIDDVIEELEDSDDISDIDNAYIRKRIN